jgi:hypothetical protein
VPSWPTIPAASQRCPALLAKDMSRSLAITAVLWPIAQTAESARPSRATRVVAVALRPSVRVCSQPLQARSEGATAPRCAIPESRAPQCCPSWPPRSGVLGPLTSIAAKTKAVQVRPPAQRAVPARASATLKGLGLRDRLSRKGRDVYMPELDVRRGQAVVMAASLRADSCCLI